MLSDLVTTISHSSLRDQRGRCQSLLLSKGSSQDKSPQVKWFWTSVVCQGSRVSNLKFIRDRLFFCLVFFLISHVYTFHCFFFVSNLSKKTCATKPGGTTPKLWAFVRLLNPPDVMHFKKLASRVGSFFFLLFTDALQCLETTSGAALPSVGALSPPVCQA